MLSTIFQINLKEINIPAQIVMLCAFIIMTCSFWFKDRKKTLVLQIIGCILFTLQYILLEAKTGAILSLICVGRAYMFKFKEGKDGKNAEFNTKRDKIINYFRKNVILYVFIIAYLIAFFVMWEGPRGILALIATLVYTVALWEEKPQNIRIGSNFAAFFWFAYNYMVGGYVGCITETIMFISNTIAIVKNRKVA